ncbi:putative DHNTP pyrophosphohydrolase [Candidatus Rubidus massiliensis]|nr:putative DHNTP pyrophosphohydrolase [Candidatus Rubidus massiliensis]
MERQFTASTYIIDNQKVLLIYHKKIRKWLPPGGHLEINETPCDAAKREALEETGIAVEFIKQENVWVNQNNANSFARPYLCLLEEIPPHITTPAHQHIDFVYVARPLRSNFSPISPEDQILRWFDLDQIEGLNEEEIFTETKEVIKSIFTTFTSLVMT